MASARRHRPARSALPAPDRADSARRAARLRVRLDLRLTCSGRSRRPRLRWPRLRPSGSSSAMVRIRHPRATVVARAPEPARHLGRDGDGHRARRLGPPLHQPAAGKGEALRGSPPNDQAVHERREGRLERRRDRARLGAEGPAADRDARGRLRAEGARHRGARRRRRDHPARGPGHHPVDDGHCAASAAEEAGRDPRRSSASCARRATSPTTSPRASRCAGSRPWCRTTCAT